jgi:5'(3')-deoxyribonucleotidase
MARVGVDCDGVLANFAHQFIAILDKVRPGHGLTEENWNSWEYGDKVSEADASAVWKIIKGTPNFWVACPAYESNVRDLARWLNTESGHDVWIITSRANTAGLSVSQQTQMWLDAIGVRAYYNYFGIITVPNPDDKVDILSRLDIDWMIDDKTETIESMDRFPYLHAALLDRPWNQDAKVKWRVKSVGEFLAAIPR